MEFLIDGRKSWSEQSPPYTYGDDGNWLVTSFLKPGKHRFMSRVTTTSGTTVDDTVAATVSKSAAPPPMLTGMWQREVSPTDVEKQTSGAPPPAGKWGLTINSIGWRLADPAHGGLIFDVAYSGRALHMRPAIARPPYPNPLVGGFCDDPDPLATWSYVTAPDGATMSLKPTGSEPCGDRRAILEGTWQRVDR